ncbi:hypothetical protein ASD88_15030 [Pelomonas sp. Root662]|nr:hypothetical protein ASC81_16510 [Pelomonas sp. Root405]KRA71118.1 hypothetical protein ASD88_15030 [Pelomonas sp. Root662]
MTASVYPAVAGLVFVEYDADGNELQKSAPTQADGSFSLTGPLSGTRLQALGTPSGATVAPLYSTQLRAASLTASRLQVTALTTWHDQLRKHGVAEEEAANRVVSLVAGNCLAQFDPTDGQQAGALHADMIVPAHNHDWLLSAVSAYLQSARAIGLGPQVDFNGWNKVLDKRGELLAQLCQYASSVSAASWKEKQALRVQTEAKVAAVDNARLDAAISEARTQGLALLARRIQLLEYPDQTAVLLPQTTAVQGQEMSLASNFVMAQYKLQASTTKSQALVAPPTPMLLGVTSTGQIVGAVQASATPTVDATALLRLSNRGGEDKRVGLTLNGQNMADLGGVLEHILALPVAHTGEPLYRKAWRYVIAQRQRTVPVAIGNFQYQPDLWLRSVGSSYCEAQATALHFIWKAMGYEARVIGLTGHVVPEVRIDGRWQVFDPYLATYYTDRGGANIVGVSELQQDTSLVSNPATPLLPLPDTAYSQLVADFYGSTDDNFPLSSVMTPTVQPMGNELQVPAGGYVDFDASAGLARPSTEPGHQVSMAQLRLWVPPGYKGVIKLPLLLVDVKGVGQVTMFGRSLDPSVTNVGALLNDFLLLSNSEVGVSELVIDSVGTGGLTLTLMLNPLYFSNRQHLTVRAFGPDVKGLSFDGEATAMPAQPL